MTEKDYRCPVCKGPMIEKPEHDECINCGYKEPITAAYVRNEIRWINEAQDDLFKFQKGD